MTGLGQKENTQAKGLGVKHKTYPYTLGNKQIITPRPVFVVDNIMFPNKPVLQITGLKKDNLIQSSPSIPHIQYLPTGLKNTLEKNK